jgi:hypothetical protein
MSIGDKVTIPLDHDVVLCCASVTMPRIKVRVVKLDDPRAPTPPPEARDRAGTLSYDPEVPAPPPAQAQKRQKRQKRREFHMLA